MKSITKPKVPNIKKYIPKERIQKMSFQELQEAGLIKETVVLHHQIKEEAEQLREQGHSVDGVKYILADKHFLSTSSIHGILYRPIGDEK